MTMWIGYDEDDLEKFYSMLDNEMKEILDKINGLSEEKWGIAVITRDVKGLFKKIERRTWYMMLKRKRSDSWEVFIDCTKNPEEIICFMEGFLEGFESKITANTYSLAENDKV